MAEPFRRYVGEGAFADLTRWLTGSGTRTGTARRDRSAVWGMLRNPAYAGTVFGKTQVQHEPTGLNRRARPRGCVTPARPEPFSKKIYYYRFLGSDDYRYEGGRVCTNKPVRADYLDTLAWDLVTGLRAGPALIRTPTQAAAGADAGVRSAPRRPAGPGWIKAMPSW